MSSLWGIPDNWAPTIDATQVEHNQLVNQNLRFTGQHLQALAQREGVQAQREGMMLKLFQQRMSQMSNRVQQAGQQGDNLEAQMRQAADDEYAMGNPDKAARIMSELGNVQARQAQVRIAKAKLEDSQAALKTKQLEDVTNLFGGVNTEDDFNRAMMIAKGRYPDLKLPPEMQTYSPANVEFLKRVTKAGLEQAKLKDQKQREADVERRHQESLAATRRNLEFREHSIEQRGQQRRDWQDRRAKSTGTKGGAASDPNPTMIRGADAALRRQFPDLERDMPLGKDDVSSAAYDVAAQAKAMMKSNPGLSADQAMARSIKQLKDAGAFESLKHEGGLLHKDTTSTRYKGGGQAPADQKAEPVPADGKFKEGVLYDPGDGSKWKYDAKKDRMVNVGG